MIDLSKLIYLLPSFFKEKDTYKDNEGRGILERFLEVCGDYFKNDITPDIDNILDIISLEKKEHLTSRDYVFINHIWEFLGSIPYGYAALYNDNDLNNPWKENLEYVPRAKYWDIIKYSISLYKIRGTALFYKVLMRFYGIDCKVLDPSGTEDAPNGYSGRYLNDKVDTKVFGTDNKRIKEVGQEEEYIISHYDSESIYDADTYYDLNSNCLNCTKVYITLTHESLGDPLVRNRILVLLNRFRPVNVYPFDITTVNFVIPK